jgi:hypothetical protein
MSGLRVRIRGDVPRHGTEGLAQMKYGRTPPMIMSVGQEVIADVDAGGCGIAHVTLAVTVAHASEDARPGAVEYPSVADVA